MPGPSSLLYAIILGMETRNHVLQIHSFIFLFTTYNIQKMYYICRLKSLITIK